MVDRLEKLHWEAQALRGETARYIPPIVLVQVERTGRETRDTGFSEALDACYVLCHDTGTATVVKAIKASLEGEGMGEQFDIGLEILDRPGLSERSQATRQEAVLDPARIVRALLDLAPNAWLVWE